MTHPAARDGEKMQRYAPSTSPQMMREHVAGQYVRYSEAAAEVHTPNCDAAPGEKR